MLKLNFRATAGFVTDAAGENHCLGEAYPTTIGGLSVGFSSDITPSGANQVRDRGGAATVELAGVAFQANGGSTIDFTIDFGAGASGGGSCVVNLALGDMGASQTQKCLIKDGPGGATLGTIAGATSNGNFLDANGSNWADTAWFASNTSKTVTLTQQKLVLTLGDTAGGASTTIAALWVDFTGGASPPTITAQPQSTAAAAVGATAQFSVTSPDATSYQWEQSLDRGLTWASVSDGSGGTTATYTTAAATSAHNGRKYRCVLTNAGGSTTSLQAFFHVSGLTRNGRATQTPGLPDAQAWERIGERTRSMAPGTWYAFRDISGGRTRDFATAARARFFPDAPPVAPPSQAIWSNRLKAELPRGYGTPLRVRRQLGVPPVLLLPVAGGLNADAALRDAADVIAATATIAIVASAAIAEAVEQAPAAATLALAANAATADQADTLAIAATAALVASQAYTEALELLGASASTATVLNVDAALLDAPDGTLAAATAALVASQATTEAAEQLAAAAAIALAGNASLRDAPDLLATAAAAALAATLAVSDTPDTLASQAAAAIALVAAIADAPDTLLAQLGAAQLTADVSITEIREGVAASVAAALVANLALADGAERVSAAAVTAIAAALATQEAPDGAAASVAAALAASQAFTEALEQVLASASPALTANASVLDRADQLAAAMATFVAALQAFDWAQTGLVASVGGVDYADVRLAFDIELLASLQPSPHNLH